MSKAPEDARTATTDKVKKALGTDKAVAMSKSENHSVLHKRGRCQIIPECYLNIHTEEGDEVEDRAVKCKRQYKRNHRASYQGCVGSSAGCFK
jgi:hypothetical protein